MNPRDEIEQIRAYLHNGHLTYEEAERLAQPAITTINKRGAELAKEHGVKFKPLTFKYLIR